MASAAAQANLELVEQFAEEVAILWVQREWMVGEPHFRLGNLCDLDERIECHLDGLRVAGDQGWKVCQAALDEWQEGGEAFAAALVALSGNDAQRIDAVLATAEESSECAQGIVSALGWLEFAEVARLLNRLLTSGSPVLGRIGIAAAAVHRRDPGPWLDGACAASDVKLRARALKAVGELGRGDLLPACRQQLAAEDLDCRYAAASAVALLSPETAAQTALQELAQSDHPRHESALRLAIRRMEPAAGKKWIAQLARREADHRQAIIACGALGDPAVVPWLIELMEKPPLARVAGEALTTITGVDLVGQRLESRPPKGFSTGPSDAADDDDIELDPDENLSWPNPAAIAKWWSANSRRFADGSRLLLGQPRELATLRQMLRVAAQRQRSAAAVELALLEPGKPVFEVRAPGRRQLGLLT